MYTSNHSSNHGGFFTQHREERSIPGNKQIGSAYNNSENISSTSLRNGAYNSNNRNQSRYVVPATTVGSSPPGSNGGQEFLLDLNKIVDGSEKRTTIMVKFYLNN